MCTHIHLHSSLHEVYTGTMWRNSAWEDELAQFTVDNRDSLPLQCFDRLTHIPEFTSQDRTRWSRLCGNIVPEDEQRHYILVQRSVLVALLGDCP